MMSLDTPLPPPLIEAWGLRDERLIADTHTSHVYRATSRLHGPVVAKCLKPEGLGELPGMAFLEWREGHGAVRLIDRIGHNCLLEDAGDLLLRDHHRSHGDEAATEIIVDVLSRLHAPSGIRYPFELVPLATHFRSLFDLAGSASKAEIADLAGWASAEALDLLAHQDNIRPLHGDLHHDNIIGDGQGRWLAIDPQGLLGDPAYDVANVFGNPLDARDTILDRDRILRLTEHFAKALDCPPRKILRYAAVHAVLSVAWTLERPLTPSGAANLEERLSFARMAQLLLIEQFVI